ncbi:UNVERIFIED_CONTAM: hypothetical protein FKN15_015111 [Acipenser sinensis]
MEQIAFRCQDINLAQYSFIAGKDYEKEKICQQYSMLGREKFKASGIVIYSQKFSTSTFEQVNAVLDAMVNLADKCCAEGADPNCYDDGATAMSEVSCMEDSPFPKHPGITKCCEEQSLERKLCLANLRVLSEEFPSLEEPTDDEICKQFTADPKGYMERLAVRFGQMIPSASFEEVLPVADYLQQGLAKCCFNPNPECLIKEKPLMKKEIGTFISKANEICENYRKLDFTVYKERTTIAVSEAGNEN